MKAKTARKKEPEAALPEVIVEEQTVVVAPKKNMIVYFSKKIMPASALIIALVALITAGYFYTQYQKTQSLLKSSAQSANQEAKNLVSEVGKLIELPTSENPTVATVSDKTKLANQPFFRNAENGDKVLIYQNAQKAILYRPSTNKIIDVAPINLSANQSPNTKEVAGAQTSVAPSKSPTPTPTLAPVKVVILNGTKTQGLAQTTENQLKEKMPEVTVVSKGNAKGDYTKTVVVDVLGTQNAVVSQIASVVGGSVDKLPQGEVVPQNAEILVILGK